MGIFRRFGSKLHHSKALRRLREQWIEAAAEWNVRDAQGQTGSNPIADPYYSPSRFDPLGSYTGVGLHGEAPVQDADDL